MTAPTSSQGGSTTFASVPAGDTDGPPDVVTVSGASLGPATTDLPSVVPAPLDDRQETGQGGAITPASVVDQRGGIAAAHH